MNESEKAEGKTCEDGPLTLAQSSKKILYAPSVELSHVRYQVYAGLSDCRRVNFARRRLREEIRTGPGISIHHTVDDDTANPFGEPDTVVSTVFIEDS